ncbi:MAG: ornithine carbamoyltransferase, partial [Spirochaetia bacterium]
YTVVAPETLQPDPETVKLCQEYAKQSGSKIELTSDVAKGLKNADVLYTDVWVSMGEEEKSKERLELLRPYRVDEKMMAATGKSDTIFMHCLPAVKGNEVTFEVIESPASKVWDEAENRKHTIKAAMLATI